MQPFRYLPDCRNRCPRVGKVRRAYHLLCRKLTAQNRRRRARRSSFRSWRGSRTDCHARTGRCGARWSRVGLPWRSELGKCDVRRLNRAGWFGRWKRPAAPRSLQTLRERARFCFPNDLWRGRNKSTSSPVMQTRSNSSPSLTWSCEWKQRVWGVSASRRKMERVITPISCLLRASAPK